MNEVKIFTQGGLNYDTELHLMPASDWADALNVRMAASDEQQEGAATNIEGRIRIGEYSYWSGVNKCIGAYADEFRNVVYAFIYNSQSRHEIIEINTETGQIVPVFKNIAWTGFNNVLMFNPRKKIHSADIIHRSEEEGDILFWTDDNSEPRRINVSKAKRWNAAGGYPDPIVYSYTTVRKEPPRAPLTVWGSDLDRTSNNVRGKLFQFQVRYLYDDYEKSVWSSWSDYSLPIQPFTPDRDSDPAINNYIDVTFTTGSALVQKIEFGVRQNNENLWGDLYLIETIDKGEQSIPNDSTYTYRFYNDSAGVLQVPAQANQQWDYVPLKAGTQAIVNGDTIVYADITEGLSFDDPLDVFMSNEEAEILPITEGENISIYKHSSKYKFGLVYFDEYNETDGVHNKQPISNDRRFEVDTTFYLANNTISDPYNIFVPKIRAAIFHRPPAWAKTYKWVRSRALTYSKYLMYVQWIHQLDNDYLYISQGGLNQSILVYGQSGLTPYTFTPGDRIRLIRRMGFAGPTENMNLDLEIIGVVKDPDTSGPVISGDQIKIARNTAAKGPNFYGEGGFYLFEIYSTSNVKDNDLYYEFGPEYQVLNAGTPSRRHQGQTQDQDILATVPATFEFIRNGDVYLRRRENMEAVYPPEQLRTFPDIPVTDVSFSDKYRSAVNGNGRAYLVDDTAKQQRYPTLIRFSNAYVQDTLINKTNNFTFENSIDTCDRSFGAIKRMSVRDRQLRVFQELKCGWIPIQQQVIQTASGNPIVTQSDKLLNDIQYYSGNFGIGNAACSLASENFVDYFHDTNRGVICRLSRDGITPLSVIAKMNRFAITEDVKYKFPAEIPPGQYPIYDSNAPGYAQIYGVFDTKNNTYISSYEEISIYDSDGVKTVTNEAKTISWDEVRNRFISFYGYHPEWALNLRNNIITFEAGVPYIHNQKDDGQRCNFNGSNGNWYIDLVFNDKFVIKKTFQCLDITSNQKLICPDISTSIVNPNSIISAAQSSSLISDDIKWKEGHWHAPLLRDANSPGGIINGDTLKGGYIKLRLQSMTPKNLISLYSATITYIPSQKNSQ